MVEINQFFHYTRCITPQLVTGWRGTFWRHSTSVIIPFRRHSTCVIVPVEEMDRNGGESLATLYSIWPARDLNLKPPAQRSNASLYH